MGLFTLCYQVSESESIPPRTRGQVESETNRYSVPVNTNHRDLVLKAYPFRVDLLHQDQVIASHKRSTGREQDVIEPTHISPPWNNGQVHLSTPSLCDHIATLCDHI